MMLLLYELSCCSTCYIVLQMCIVVTDAIVNTDKA